MCDALENENPGCYKPETTFLEPTCGDGVFVMEVLRRKFAYCKKRADYTTAINSVWAMELQEDNVKKAIENVTALCREYFTPTKADLQTINDHVIQCDSLKVMKLLNWWKSKGGDEDGMDWNIGAWRCSECKAMSPMW